MKRITNRIAFLILTLITLSMLGGCSGGGADSGGPTITGTGKFIDGPVSGLAYSSVSFSGTTNQEGEFSYKKGEEISFSYLGVVIGKATIDTAKSDVIVTPRNLVENSINPDMLLNILRFLQTLDEDSNHENGIQLPEPDSVSTAISNVDFDVSEAVFEANTNVIQFITDVSGNDELIESDEALSNFQEALEEADVHPLEGLTVYRFENGSPSSLGFDHTALWCDTWKFSNGKIYGNTRTLDNLDVCTAVSTTPFASYTTNNEGNFVWTLDYDDGDGDGDAPFEMVLLNDSAPFLYRFGSLTGDRERNQLYLTKEEVALLLASSSFESNGDLMEVSLTETSPSVFRLEAAFKNRSCTVVQSRYDMPKFTSSANQYFDPTSYFTQSGDDCLAATTINSPQDGTKFFVVARGLDGIGLENLKASIVFNN